MSDTLGAWHDRLNRVMPWGSSTCSKAPKLLPEEPQVIVRGKGCRVWDDHGREFIDYRNSLGPVTLGYCYEPVNQAVRKQLDRGIIFGHPHPLECEVAEMLCEMIPCAEQARFLKTGGEALAATIRLARYHTRRDHVIQIGYNGWLNSLSAGGAVLPGQTAAAYPPGVPESIGKLYHGCGWNDTQNVEDLFAQFDGQIAAVVVAANYSDMHLGETFYPFLRDITTRHGSVLIYDEIVTGFRIAIGGAQEYFGVLPDLAVFAKGMANGLPLSAYVGAREFMKGFEKVTVSSTYGGETLSLAGAKVALQTYRDHSVVDHLWATGAHLWEQVNELMAAHAVPISLQGFWPCPQWSVGISDQWKDSAALQERFFRLCYKHGLSFYLVSYINFSHQETDVQDTLERLAAVVGELRQSS